MTLFTVDNLKERTEYAFRVAAENEIGAGVPTETDRVRLRPHARKSA